MALSRNNVKVGGLRSRLGVEMLEDRVNPTSPVGYLDFAGPAAGSSYIAGWSVDPDVPYTPIQVHIYIDGAIAAVVNTGQYRGDLGQNWGFSAQIPSQFLTPAQHWVVAYGIDSTGTSWSLLNGVKYYNGLPGDVTLGYNGVTMHTSGSLAGAIDSLSWGGQEFLNSYDHGRELQSAVFGVTNGNPTTNQQAYNPTEAGRLADGAPNLQTTSRLDSISNPSQYELLTTTTMANFPYATDPGVTINGLTQVQVSKHIGFGFGGQSNIVWIRNTFTVPNEEGGAYAIKFQPPIIFTNRNTLGSFGYYNPTNSGIYYLTNNGGSVPTPNNYPGVMMGSNGSYALSIVTRQISGTALFSDSTTNFSGTYTTSGYWGTPGGTGSDYGVMGRDYVGQVGQGQSLAGTYVFDSYVVVGNGNDVTTGLNWLHQNGYF